MRQLSIEAKEAIIAKALTRGDTSLQEIAAECNVAHSTLHKWLRLQREGLPLPGERRRHALKAQSQTPPLEHLLATARLDEQAIGAYCREQGIHSFQLTRWKEELMKQASNNKRSGASSNELKALRKENKNLKKDLRRKEKALAETSALLVLKKKADLIWGELEDD